MAPTARARRIALSLIIGAALTYGCVLVLPLTPITGYDLHHPPLPTLPVVVEEMYINGMVVKRFGYSWSGWSSVSGNDLRITRITAGFPFRAFEYRRGEYHSAEIAGWQTPSIAIPDLLRPPLGGDVVPIVPMLPGFIANVGVYTVLTWILWSGVLYLRRALRAHRGRCQHCAYPLNDLPICPECGLMCQGHPGRVRRTHTRPTWPWHTPI